MSQTQQEKQQVFREKLQAEGADAFADGPRPWEQWDESGNQDDERVWEGTARRIYPKQQAKRSWGDRLLSGLAVIALATMLVGIAGVYLSTTSTPQLASSAIQPAPIITDRRSATDARTSTDTPADRAAETTVSLASLETLSPPAAGIPATPEQDIIVLEPVELEPAMEPAWQPAPTTATDHFDRVAVETIITETAVTTTVYTQQPYQDEPELVATIATTPPPFLAKPAESEAPVMVAAQENIHPEQVPELIPELIEAPATEPEIIAQAEVTVTEPETIEQTEIPATVPVFDEQATVESLASSEKNDVTEPTGDEAPELIALNSSDESVEAVPDVVQEIETTTRTPVLPDAKTGKWVINISSYTRKPTAERMLAVFKQQGIDAEVFTTTINDKPMHRIRVTGFQSSRAAKAEIPAIEKTLDLEGIWISKR